MRLHLFSRLILYYYEDSGNKIFTQVDCNFIERFAVRGIRHIVIGEFLRNPAAKRFSKKYFQAQTYLFLS